MNPENQAPGTLPPVGGQPPTPSGPHNPYGFIINAPKPARKKLLKTNSLRSRLLLIVGAAAIIIVGIMVISSFLTRSNKALTVELKLLVAEQQEVVRVSSLGLVSKDVALKTWIQTVKTTVTSQQTTLVSYLGQKGIVLEPLELNAKLNKKTDAALAEATANSRFDQAYREVLTATLFAYAEDLKKTYQSVDNPTSKSLLNESYVSVASLLQK